MKRTAAILTALGWTAVFTLVSIFALFGAEDGAASAMERFGLPFAAPAFGSIPEQALMGGLCFGAAAVAALFATVALSHTLSPEEGASQTRYLNEIAHGGAFGVAGLISLTVALGGGGAALACALAWLALLVGSLVWLRTALADPLPVPLEAPVVARRMAEQAAANVNVVRFPFYRAGGAA